MRGISVQEALCMNYVIRLGNEMEESITGSRGRPGPLPAPGKAVNAKPVRTGAV